MENRSTRSYLNEICSFVAPLCLARQVEITGCFVPAIYFSWLGDETLAASALITSSTFFIAAGLKFFLYSVPFLTGEAHGQFNINKKSLYLHYACLYALFLSVPSFIMSYNMKYILLAFGQPPRIVNITAEYFKPFSFALPAFFIFTAAQQYATGIKLKWAFLYSNLFNQAISLSMGYFLIFEMGYGVNGMAYANLISYSLSAAVLLKFLLSNNML